MHLIKPKNNPAADRFNHFAGNISLNQFNKILPFCLLELFPVSVILLKNQKLTIQVQSYQKAR